MILRLIVQAVAIAMRELPPQLGGGERLLGAGQKVDGQKPLPQIRPGSLKQGAGGNRGLVAAGAAFKERPLLMRISAVMAAAGAAITVRPAVLKKSSLAVFLCSVHLHESYQCLGAVH